MSRQRIKHKMYRSLEKAPEKNAEPLFWLLVGCVAIVFLLTFILLSAEQIFGVSFPR